MTARITVTVVETKGSAPREPGAAMVVWADRTEGTIGGGTLEWEAIAQARQMLADGTQRAERRVSLGPDIGQCCGGSVLLGFTAGADSGARARSAIWIWGAGHVGRALVTMLAPVPGLSLTWVDTSPERFPQEVAPNVSLRATPDPAAAVALAPREARHYVFTYSHPLDLAICDALLSHGFAAAGLIGSATKWARFRSRLGQMGHSPAQVARIQCPIGEKALGKDPSAIAVGVAYALLMELAQKEANSPALRDRGIRDDGRALDA